MHRSERLATSVTPEKKVDFQIAAMRRDMKEAELLRQTVDEFLQEEDIPEEVRQYFKEKNGDGNPSARIVARDVG